MVHHGRGRVVQVCGINQSAITVLWEHVTLSGANTCNCRDRKKNCSADPDPKRQDRTEYQSTQRPLYNVKVIEVIKVCDIQALTFSYIYIESPLKILPLILK